MLAEGKKHDASMLVDSNVLHELEQNAFSPTGEPMCVFGDPAYPLRVHLQAPFRHGILTPAMEAYNAEMSSVRVTVEWLFGDVINGFKYLDFKKNLKIGMSSAGKMYLVCAILNNAITCLYGNSTLLPYRTTSHKSNVLNEFISVKVNIHIISSVSSFKGQWFTGIKRPKSYLKLTTNE